MGLDIVQSLIELIRRASTDLPRDVEARLEQMRDEEAADSASRRALETILENVQLARSRSTPICQDTGVPVFYITGPVGLDTRLLTEQVESAVREATRQSILRPNAVDPVTGRNTGDNVGRGMPIVHVQQWDRDELKVDLLLKGAGSENVSRQYKLPYNELEAGRDLEGVRRVVLDAVYQAQGRGCAPGILSVVIGGDRAAGYEGAKRRFLEPLGTPHPDPRMRELEQQLVTACNQLEIGPMGFGGETTVLDVKVDVLHRHPASYFVTVAYLCWACRRASVTLSIES